MYRRLCCYPTRLLSYSTLLPVSLLCGLDDDLLIFWSTLFYKNIVTRFDVISLGSPRLVNDFFVYYPWQRFRTWPLVTFSGQIYCLTSYCGSAYATPTAFVLSRLRSISISCLCNQLSFLLAPYFKCFHALFQAISIKNIRTFSFHCKCLHLCFFFISFLSQNEQLFLLEKAPYFDKLLQLTCISNTKWKI